MCGPHHSAQLSSPAKSGLLGVSLALGLAFAASPAAAGDAVIDCVLGSKDPVPQLIAACTTTIDQSGNAATERAAALVMRADANAKTSGGLSQALKDLDRAIALDGRNARAFRLRGDLRREAGGDLNRAAADLSKAIELDPQDAEAYELRGVVYTNQRRLDRAIADYDQALRLEQRPNFFTNRGDSHQFKGELGAALSDYDAALKLDPNFALTYNNRAVLYKKMGERKQALADYEAALRLDPGNDNAADGRRAMIAEIAKFGTEPSRPLTAPSGNGPSFDCAFAKREVEKVICADPQLGALDRQIADAFARVRKALSGRAAGDLRRTQRDFLTARNASFGRPGYDLKKAMQERLQRLNAHDS